MEIQGTNQASHALQQNIHAKLAARLATSLPDASQNLKAVNQIAQEEKLAYLNAWQDDLSNFICQIQDQKTITKCLYANLPLVQQPHHRRHTYLRVRIDPGADVNVMPAAVYKQLNVIQD